MALSPPAPLGMPAATRSTQVFNAFSVDVEDYFSLRDHSPQARQQLIAACKKYLTDHPGAVWFAVGPVDFALAFAMVHEVPDQRRLLGEIHGCLKPGGKLLVTEPRLHVSGKAFGQTVALAEEAGLKVVEEPKVRWCRAVVLGKDA